MEPDDNSYYRVILRPEQRHTVLDAHRWGIYFSTSQSGDQILNSIDLPYQVAMLYALIQCFGPNQVVGIKALEDPLENLSFERAFFSETLNSYLSLPYILQFIIIHKVPEISFPPWHTLPQVISSGWEQSRYCNWWPLFQRYQFDPQYPKKGTHDTADSCTMGPLFVKGLFKTIAFSRRTGRKSRQSKSARGQSN